MHTSLLLSLLCCCLTTSDPLPETRPLTGEDDLATQMVAGIDRYLTRELAASVERRKQLWKLDCATPDSVRRTQEPHRAQLRRLLGVVDERVPFTELEYVATTGQPALVAETRAYKVYTVRWPVLPGVDGEGLLVEPEGAALASVVAVPDADWTPEMLLGLVPLPTLAARAGTGKETEADHAVEEGFRKMEWNERQFGRRLAENGCRILIPTLISRQDTWSGNARIGRMTNQPHREFVYRMAFEMGRHVIGYEVQKVLAAVDWLARAQDHPPIGIYGYGEGGQVAFYAGALDPRIRATVVGGYFGPREAMWQEPIYRNVWGLLCGFGDAEVAAGFYLPRGNHVAAQDKPLWQELLIEDSQRPRVDGPPAARQGRGGAAPGRIPPLDVKPGTTTSAVEARRAQGLAGGTNNATLFYSIVGGGGRATITNPITLEQFLAILGRATPAPEGSIPTDHRPHFDPGPRQKRQLDQLIAFTQQLMRDAETRRGEFFWSKLDTASLEKYQASCKPLRARLWEEVIGKLPAPTEPANPRSRQVYDEPKWKGYEVQLDLYPDVFAYGILLVPKDLKPGERRPVVVCQHGLEGRPQAVVNPKQRTRHYNSFGAQLADRGYIVYAPQNPYIGQDKFRVLQRKANPLGLSLFSFVVRQHERTLDWLSGLPFVDAKRMAFYGLSYGGKTAMRVPAILDRYCLSICSGDFNEWIWKNTSVDYLGSYVFSGEYEMPEFNLGNTFNYAEMAALIAPRPFMVERGHDDGVGIDEWVAYEYAKVRRLYAKLGLPDRTAIEFFDGEHEIHGRGTFEFLDRHLHWGEDKH